MATNPLLPRSDDSGLQRRQLAAVLSNSGTESHIRILLPQRFYNSLGSRLLSHIRDLLFPQKYPPLRNLSQPINVILPIGEMLRAPWYRTIFTNLGDVLAPENLPPLQLESRPAEVEELISDLTAEPWWRSLLRSLGEAISPEQLPPLELESRPAEIEELISDSTSTPWWKSLIRSIGDEVSPEVLPSLELSATPINPGISEVGLVTPHWSSLISAPAAAVTAVRAASEAPAREPVAHIEPRAPIKLPESLPVPLQALQVDADSVGILVAQFQDNLSRSKRRELIWISLASVEIVFLIALATGLLH